MSVSDEDREVFIERFNLERLAREDVEEEEDFTEEEIEYARTRRSSTLFWSGMAFLGLCPFILSGLLLYVVGRYEQLVGPGGLEALSATLTAEEIKSMATETGIPELEFFLKVYENKHLIIALTFTAFFTLIAALVVIRGLIIMYRGRTHEQEV